VCAWRYAGRIFTKVRYRPLSQPSDLRRVNGRGFFPDTDAGRQHWVTPVTVSFHSGMQMGRFVDLQRSAASRALYCLKTLRPSTVGEDGTGQCLGIWQSCGSGSWNVQTADFIIRPGCQSIGNKPASLKPAAKRRAQAGNFRGKNGLARYCRTPWRNSTFSVRGRVAFELITTRAPTKWNSKVISTPTRCCSNQPGISLLPPL